MTSQPQTYLVEQFHLSEQRYRGAEAQLEALTQERSQQEVCAATYLLTGCHAPATVLLRRAPESMLDFHNWHLFSQEALVALRQQNGMLRRDLERMIAQVMQLNLGSFLFWIHHRLADRPASSMTCLIERTPYCWLNHSIYVGRCCTAWHS